LLDAFGPACPCPFPSPVGHRRWKDWSTSRCFLLFSQGMNAIPGQVKESSFCSSLSRVSSGMDRDLRTLPFFSSAPPSMSPRRKDRNYRAERRKLAPFLPFPTKEGSRSGRVFPFFCHWFHEEITGRREQFLHCPLFFTLYRETDRKFFAFFSGDESKWTAPVTLLLGAAFSFSSPFRRKINVAR